MSEELGKQIVDALARDLSQYKFNERHDNVTKNIVGIIKKSWNPLRRVMGGHGISAVVVVPGSVTDRVGLKAFFHDIRKEINSRFVGFAAYKSSHSFIVLVCPHGLFTASSGIASELKDRSGLHMNIIQGIILVDGETKEVTGDYTRPAQHKREYEAVLSATSVAVK
jgi:hypothetical protein